MDIKNFVFQGNKVFFMSYRQGFFMYSLWDKEEVPYSFPIPLDDIGTATMLDEDKTLIEIK